MNGKDIFLGLKYVGDDLIEKAEYGQFPTKAEKAVKMHRGLRRPLVLAAAICLMLLLVGCAVVYVLSMQGIKLGEQTVTREVFEYDPNSGEAVAYVGKENYVEQVFTIAGLQDSPANQAAQEWFSFTQEYDPDLKIQGEVWGKEPDFPEEYDSYHIYTDEMKEKIDEICQKYGLKLAGKQMEFHTGMNVCDALGIQRIQSSEHDVFLKIDNARCWKNGNFYLEYDIYYPETEGNELSDTWGTIQWNRKDCFSDDIITYEDTGDWKEREYTTTSGHKALITSSPSHARSYVICDREDAVMSVMVDNQWSCGYGEDRKSWYLSDRQMEQLVDAIDHAIEPRRPTQKDVKNQTAYIGEETQAGYKVKVKSTKTDGWMTRVVLGITAPEGTVISRNPHRGFKDVQYHIGFTNDQFLPDRKRMEIGANGGWNVRDDGDGLENTVDLVIERFAEMEDGSAPFGWGTSWDIWLEDVVGKYWNDWNHKFKEDILVEAGWHFRVSFNEINGDYREIEFAENPFTMSAVVGFEMDGTDVFGDVEVTSFTLRSMSATIRHDCGYAVDFHGPMYAVMKDGRQIAFQSAGAIPGGTCYIMESHVNVDEVDHVLLADGTKLMVPEA